MAGVSSSALSTSAQPSTSFIRPPSTSIMASTVPQGDPPTITKYFSRGQLALALSIAKSKPKGLPMRDYCGLLRHRIAMNNPRANRENLRHVDGCEFWKDLHDKIYQDNTRLQSKIGLLEERLRSYDNATAPDSQLQNEIINSVMKPSVLAEMEEWQEHDNLNEVSLVGDPRYRLSSHAVRIFLERHKTARIVNNSDLPNHIDQVWKSACALNAVLESALTDCLKYPLLSLWTLKCDSETEKVRSIEKLMLQIALGFSSSFEALNELGKTIPGRTKRAEIISGLVYIFKHALDYLHTVSGLQAAGDDIANDRRRHHKRPKITQCEYAVNKYLSKTLIHMTQMDWRTGNLCHGEILEGILCSILIYTGHLLSHTVFNEHVAASDNAGNISMGDPISQISAIKFEFRYLIHILHSALGGATKGNLIARILNERRSGRSGGLHGQSLSSARELLQKTLMKSVVGADGETLKLPKELEITAAPELSHHGEEYDRGWFQEAVWALVGWDLVLPSDD